MDPPTPALRRPSGRRSPRPPAIGNGTLVSRYMQVGKTVDWEVRI